MIHVCENKIKCENVRMCQVSVCDKKGDGTCSLSLSPFDYMFTLDWVEIMSVKTCFTRSTVI